MGPPEGKQLRVLCFGDSLTAGCWRGPPYASLISGKGCVAEAVDVGHPGYTTGQLHRCLEEALEEKPGAFDVCVVLAGTNDLGRGVGNEQTMTNLRDLYSMAEAAGLRVVAVTVPPLKFNDPDGPIFAARRELNARLVAEAGARRIPVADFYSALYGDGVDTPAFFDDNVHMNPAGYGVLAGVVQEVLDAL